MSGAVIVDTNTKSCTFLTLTQYNPNKDTVIPAVCSIRKGEPFLDSDRAFIAAESWRLSVAPNKSGIVYHEIPWTYYISCDQAVSAQQDVDANDEKNNAEMIPLNSDLHPVLFVDLLQDKKTLLPNKQRLTIKTKAAEQHNRTVDINRLSERLMKFMNHQMMTKGSIVQLTNPAVGVLAEQPYLYTFVDNPVDKLTGPGYGPQGLLKVPGYYVYESASFNNDGNFITSLAPAQVNYIRYRIKKSQVPNMTLADIKRYFSRGLWLFRERDAFDGSGAAAFKVFGPMFCQTTDDTQSISTNHHESPIHQLYCKNGATFAVGQQVFQQYKDSAGKLLEKSSVLTSMQEFGFDDGDYFWVHLCGVPTPAGIAGQAYHNHEVFASPPTFNQLYYAYDAPVSPTSELMGDSVPIYDLLTSVCDVTVTDHDKNPLPSAFITLANTTTTTFPFLVHRSSQRTRVTRRATEQEVVLTYSPNDFMQYFNCGFSDDQEQPYVLCTDPNGGWRLVVLSDKLSSLRISKFMVDDMGLNNFMTVEGIEKTSTKRLETYPIVVEILPDKDLDDAWQWTWKEDFSTIATAQSLLQSRHTAEFIKIKKTTGAADGPLLNSDQPPQLMYDINETSGRRYYELINMVNEELVQTDVSTINQRGHLKTDDDGVPFYEFTSVKKGSFIGNDSTVSIGSFSKYESIRIVVPSGSSFQPQIAAGSDARVLAELRLPFQNSAEVQQGFLENKPLVMTTESAFLGDLTWSNPPSGLQYLPITTQGGIYDMEVAVELISRDPNTTPVRVQLGYNQLFQIKLRFINRT